MADLHTAPPTRPAVTEAAVDVARRVLDESLLSDEQITAFTPVLLDALAAAAPHIAGPRSHT